MTVVNPFPMQLCVKISDYYTASVEHVVCIHLVGIHFKHFKGFWRIHGEEYAVETQGLNVNIYIYSKYTQHKHIGIAVGGGCKVNIYTGHRSPDKSKRSSNIKRAHLKLGLLPALRVHEGNIYLPFPSAPPARSSVIIAVCTFIDGSFYCILYSIYIYIHVWMCVCV